MAGLMTVGAETGRYALRGEATLRPCSGRRAGREESGGAVDRSLCGGEARDGDTEGRATDVVHALFVAEYDGGGIAAVLAADPDLETLFGGAAEPDAGGDELPDAVAVDGLEGILVQDVLAEIFGEEGVSVVAAEAERELSEVVGAEGEEVGVVGDLVGGECGARDLDHGADLDVHATLAVVLGADEPDGVFGESAVFSKFVRDVDERDHDLGGGLYISVGALVGGLGVSGDGVDQDDYVTAGGLQGFEAAPELRADRVSLGGVALPYLKFPRAPEQ